MRFIGGYITGMLLSIVIVACAAGGRSYKPRPRAVTDKLYVPCHASWIASPEGKMCNRTCTKRREKKCKAWKITVKDMRVDADWQFMKDGGFGCLDLDQIL